jgi:hypothetical protein
MDRVPVWMQLLLLVLILRQSAAAPDQASELREEIDRLRNLNQRHELLVAQCQVRMLHDAILIQNSDLFMK